MINFSILFPSEEIKKEEKNVEKNNIHNTKDTNNEENVFDINNNLLLRVFIFNFFGSLTYYFFKVI